MRNVTKLVRIRSDKKAEMGIGTMILFIAMVLVAAIAASLLITTASQLNQRAQETGTIAEQEVSTGVMMRNIQGDRLINGEGPNAEMPAVDSVAPTTATISVSMIQGINDDTGDTKASYYAYSITISSPASDTRAGLMKEELYRSEDGTIGGSDDTLIKTTTNLAGNLFSSYYYSNSKNFFDVPVPKSDTTGDGAGVFYYYIKSYDKAGNSANSNIITDNSNHILTSDIDVDAVDDTTATATTLEVDDDDYTGYEGFGLYYNDADNSEEYYFIIDSVSYSGGTTTFTFDSSSVGSATPFDTITDPDQVNLFGINITDNNRPVLPTLGPSGEFKAISQGLGSGRILLQITDLDLSGAIDAVDTVGDTLITLPGSSSGGPTKLGRIRGYNVYRILGSSGSVSGSAPNMAPIGFWDITDFADPDGDGYYGSNWYDYIQKTGGNEKTGYSYAIAAVDLSGNEGNMYHFSSEDYVGYALWTSEPCASSCTKDISLPEWVTYSITATPGSSSVTLAWTAASSPSDSGSGITNEDFQGQVKQQKEEIYGFEIWRGLEPIFEKSQLPINGRVNPLVSLAGYAKSSDTSFEDFGIDWKTDDKKAFEGNVYYYAICAVDNAGNRILKPGLSEDIKVLEFKVALQAGSPGVDFDLVRVEITDGSTTTDLTFGGLGEPSEATASTFVVQITRDVDGDFIKGNVLTPGSIVKIIVNCDAPGFNIKPQTHVSLQIIPKHGVPTAEEFTSPSTYSDRYIQLI